MIVGVMLLSLIAAFGAALTAVLLGYGVLTALGFYMLGGLFGVLSTLLIAVARQQQAPDTQLVHGNA